MRPTRISFVSIFVHIFLPSPRNARNGLVLSRLQNKEEKAAEKFAPKICLLLCVQFALCSCSCSVSDLIIYILYLM